jgi:hypothetical protein
MGYYVASSQEGNNTAIILFFTSGFSCVEMRTENTITDRTFARRLNRSAADLPDALTFIRS